MDFAGNLKRESAKNGIDNNIYHMTLFSGLRPVIKSVCQHVHNTWLLARNVMMSW